MRAGLGILAGLLGLGLALVGSAEALDRTALTCGASDVQIAINLAVAGDRVVLPTCTGGVAWTTTVTWTAPANVTMIGAGTTAVGGGDRTVIIDNVAGNVPLLSITTNASGTFRLSGITFRNGTGVTRDNGPIMFAGSSKSFRVDHIRLQNLPGNGQIIIDGWIYGVFDHIISDSSSVVNAIKIFHSGWNNDSFNAGDASWADTTTFGSNRFIFVEDSVFNGGAANDCSSGGRYVFRHNTFTVTVPPSLGLQTHPTGGGARHRGCRALEIYANTFTAQGSSIDAVIWMSSGTGLVWGNTLVQTGGNDFSRFFKLLSMRFAGQANGGTYNQSAPPAGWGYCGTTFGPSNFDANADATGWPCIDDPGRGKGDLLTSDFQGQGGPATGPSNTATGCNSTQTCVNPRQAAEPVYEWLNTIGSTQRINVTGGKLQANRDYYSTNASFNGTSGTGSGLFTARPSTCTTGVAYWATDTSRLYQCTATNTWTLYYTPYTYPHPLVAYTTNFPTAPQNPLAEGGASNWKNGLADGLVWANCRTVASPNRAIGTQTGAASPPYNDSVCLLTGSWGADQTAQGTVYITSASSTIFHEVELRLRSTVTANSSTGYEILVGLGFGAPYTEVVRWNGPLSGFTSIDSNTTSFAHGDIVRASVTGTGPVTITVFKSTNGGASFSTVLTVVDSGPGVITSGNPGMGFFLWDQQGGNQSALNPNFGFTCFSATDSGTPALCTSTTPPAAPTGMLISQHDDEDP